MIRPLSKIAVVMLFVAGCDPASLPQPAASPAATAAKVACHDGWVVAPRPELPSKGRFRLEAIAGEAPNELWAVGRFQASPNESRPLIHFWDGESWSESSLPEFSEPAKLVSVASVASNAVWAAGLVGDPPRPLVVHWAGQAWTEMTPPPSGSAAEQPAGPQILAAAGPDDIWLMTRDRQAHPQGGLVDIDVFNHWDGRTWTAFAGAEIIHPDVGTYTAHAITISLDGHPWAAGEKAETGFESFERTPGSFLERWDGSQWVEEEGPDENAGTSLLAVAADDDMWVVQGDPFIPGGFERILRHWDGDAWSEPLHAIGTVGLATRSPGDAWAVGTIDRQTPFIGRWTSSEWQRVDTEVPKAVTSGLQALTVTSSGAVVAFGSDYAASLGAGDQDPRDRANNYLWVNCP